MLDSKCFFLARFVMNTVRVILLGAAITGAFAIPACGLQAMDEANSTGAGGSTSASSGTGGEDGDASIVLGPDGETPPDPYHPYTALCGAGCVPGAQPDECASQGGEGGAGGSGPPACQLVPGSDGDATPQCGPTGAFAAGGPCTGVADCAPGLGCAATGEVAGACRQYCCGHVEDCAAGTYCAPQPMQEDADAAIPVCIPADNCELLSDTCGPELTCTIVRADGTTSCVEPGQGEVREPCPCAAGFVCSLLTNECKKLCHLGQAANDCGPNTECQGGSMGFPAGFGVCVGGNY